MRRLVVRPAYILLLVLASCGGSPESDAEAPVGTAPARSGLQTGIAVPGSDPAKLAELEADIGTSFDVVRVFRRWNDLVPGAADSELVSLVESGHRIHLSVRPLRSDGTPIAWADLAAARPGDPLYAELEAWLAAVQELPDGTYFTISHEPETKEGAVNGTASDFKAMWRRIVSLLREQSGDDVVMVWTMTGGAFSDDRADEWYPGDEFVDVVGTDSYNWFTCQGGERPWYELEQLLSQPLRFARAHDKPLAVPEFASAEDPTSPERRVQWINNAAGFLGRPDVADSIEFVAWFNVTAPGGTYPDCVWDIDTTRQSAEAFGEMMRTLNQPAD